MSLFQAFGDLELEFRELERQLSEKNEKLEAIKKLASLFVQPTQKFDLLSKTNAVGYLFQSFTSLKLESQQLSSLANSRLQQDAVKDKALCLRQSRIQDKFEDRLSKMKLPLEQSYTIMRVLRLNSFYLAQLDLSQHVARIIGGAVTSSVLDAHWQLVNSDIEHKFLPFCRYVFVNMDSIMVLGGLDDTHSGLADFFSNYCYELRVLRFHLNDEMFACNPKSSMLNGRGCFGTCLNEKFIFVFGGVVGRSICQSAADYAKPEI